MLNDFFNLIFPRLCSACNTALLKNEQTLCTRCIITLPKTNFHNDRENPVAKIFWGRANVEMASAYYFFSKGGKVQNLLHNLKYRGAKEVGEKIGNLYGQELKNCKLFDGIDYVVPIPLHKNKLKKRGFNQSEFFANGLALSMGIEENSSDFYRQVDTQTQTKKTRYKRWENVEDIFALQPNSVLKGKNILLVDDVITTGATMEAAIHVLLKNNCKVFVVTIAKA